MGLLDCVSSPDVRRQASSSRSQLPPSSPAARSESKMSFSGFSATSSIRGRKDIDSWRNRVLVFIFKPEGKEDISVLRVPFKQFGYNTVTDFISAIPQDMFETFQGQIRPEPGFVKDHKVVWYKDGIAELGLFKWIGEIDGHQCMGLQLDRRKAVPFGLNDGKGLFYCKPGHRALVPVSEVFAYKQFLRGFLGVPPRRDSMVLNLRTDSRREKAKQYKQGDHVYLTNEKKWATIQWAGRIESDTVVDLVYDQTMGPNGRPVNPDERPMSRTLSMSDFVEQVGLPEKELEEIVQKGRKARTLSSPMETDEVFEDSDYSVDEPPTFKAATPRTKSPVDYRYYDPNELKILDTGSESDEVLSDETYSSSSEEEVRHKTHEDLSKLAVTPPPMRDPKEGDNSFENVEERVKMPSKESQKSEPLPVKTPSKESPKTQPLPVKMPSKESPKAQPLPVKESPKAQPLPVKESPKAQPLPVKESPKAQPLPVKESPKVQVLPPENELKVEIIWNPSESQENASDSHQQKNSPKAPILQPVRLSPIHSPIDIPPQNLSLKKKDRRRSQEPEPNSPREEKQSQKVHPDNLKDGHDRKQSGSSSSSTGSRGKRVQRGSKLSRTRSKSYSSTSEDETEIKQKKIDSKSLRAGTKIDTVNKDVLIEQEQSPKEIVNVDAKKSFNDTNDEDTIRPISPVTKDTGITLSNAFGEGRSRIGSKGKSPKSPKQGLNFLFPKSFTSSYTYKPFKSASSPDAVLTNADKISEDVKRDDSFKKKSANTKSRKLFPLYTPKKKVRKENFDSSKLFEETKVQHIAPAPKNESPTVHDRPSLQGEHNVSMQGSSKNAETINIVQEAKSSISSANTDSLSSWEVLHCEEGTFQDERMLVTPENNELNFSPPPKMDSPKTEKENHEVPVPSKARKNSKGRSLFSFSKKSKPLKSNGEDTGEAIRDYLHSPQITMNDNNKFNPRKYSGNEEDDEVFQKHEEPTSPQSQVPEEKLRSNSEKLPRRKSSETKKESTKSSFIRRFSLTKKSSMDKSKDKEALERKQSSSKEPRFSSSALYESTKKDLESRDKATSSLVDIRSWKERRGDSQEDLMDSYSYSHPVTTGSSSDALESIPPALRAITPESDVPKHRIFTTPSLWSSLRGKSKKDHPAKHSKYVELEALSNKHRNDDKTSEAEVGKPKESEPERPCDNDESLQGRPSDIVPTVAVEIGPTVVPGVPPRLPPKVPDFESPVPDAEDGSTSVIFHQVPSPTTSKPVENITIISPAEPVEVSESQVPLQRSMLQRPSQFPNPSLMFSTPKPFVPQVSVIKPPRITGHISPPLPVERPTSPASPSAMNSKTFVESLLGMQSRPPRSPVKKDSLLLDNDTPPPIPTSGPPKDTNDTSQSEVILSLTSSDMNKSPEPMTSLKLSSPPMRKKSPPPLPSTPPPKPPLSPRPRDPPTPSRIPVFVNPNTSPLKSAMKQRKQISFIPNGIKVSDRVVWYNGSTPIPGTVLRLYKDGTDKYTAVVEFDRDNVIEPLSLLREGDGYEVTVEELVRSENSTMDPKNPVQNGNTTHPDSEDGLKQAEENGITRPLSVQFRNSVEEAPSPRPFSTTSTMSGGSQNEEGLPPPFQENEINLACGLRRGIQAYERTCCFETILFSLYYTSCAFDIQTLYENAYEDSAMTQEVKQILRNDIVRPLREQGFTSSSAMNKLRNVLKSELNSLAKDAEVMLFILFERALRLKEFITYSTDVKDFLHQLIINPKDRSQSITLQHLFESSLDQMDKLKLKTIPTPALILEMPRSKNSLVQYEAIIPTLSLNLAHILENGPRLCLCGMSATFECKQCVSGKIVFCDHCKDMAHQLHHTLDHEPNLVSLVQMDCYMDLSAVICIEAGHYFTFVKCGTERFSPWLFFDAAEINNPQVSIEQHLSMWLDRLEKHPGKYLEAFSHPLLKRILSASHICIYQARNRGSYV